MTPGAGTPDHVASTIRIPSMRRPGARARAWLPAALLSLPIVLAGCTSRPPAPDADAGAMSAEAMARGARNDPGPPPTSEAARSRPGPVATIADRPRAPMRPAESVMPGGVPAATPARPGGDAAVSRDAWARIRDGLSLPHPAHPRVERAIGWYGKHPEYLHRTTQRARPYLAYIVREVEQRGLPMEFALLPVVESAFQVRAYSSAGAAGLWQFMPATGRRYGLEQNWWYDGRRDVVASTRAALDYLTKLLQDFDGDRLLAVAAYNWGEGNVGRELSRNRSRGRPVDVWSLKLPRETRSHVSRLLAIASIVEDPGRYGVVLEPISDRPYFQQVPLDGQMDLGVAADLAGVTLDEVRRLNPGFKRGATDPRGPHRLQLPSHAVGQFMAGLAERPARKTRSHWMRHRIVRGDTLGAIAGRYGTSVQALKDLNGLASDRIRAGRHLMVPVPAGTPGASGSGSTTQAVLDRGVAGGPGKSIHRVRNGESLWRIARRHGVDVRRLAAWNGLPIETMLRPGQRLTVYHGSAAPPRAAPPPRPAEEEPASPSAVIHVVEHGDTLYAIARRHGTTVLELAKFNRINESAILRSGQKLRVVPAAYPESPEGGESIRYLVKRGDSLWGISRRFGVSVASLREWNRLSKGDLLMPGRELDVRLTQAPAI